MGSEENNLLFDWSLYGSMIHHERIKQGYKNAVDFSRTVFLRTRLKISKDVIARIEQNRQEPTAMQFIAINLSLFGEIFPSYRANISACLSEEWLSYSENEETPDEWKRNNLKSFFKENEVFDISGNPVVFTCDLPDDDSLFVPESDKCEESGRGKLPAGFEDNTSLIESLIGLYAVVDGIEVYW